MNLQVVFAKTKTDSIFDFIYLSREDANYRKVINEEAIFTMLSYYGFKKVKASELSLIDQINYFAHAKIIVGAHSAGLINCMYSDSRLKLIELHHPDYSRHGSGLTMAQMAYYSNIEYYPICCDSPTRENDLTNHFNKDTVRTADLIAPISKIENLIVKLMYDGVK